MKTNTTSLIVFNYFELFYASEARKEAKADKRRSSSNFDYKKAGGFYVPTKIQSDAAFKALATLDLTPDQEAACHEIISNYSMNEKVHHDYIHIVNELVRGGLVKI